MKFFEIIKAQAVNLGLKLVKNKKKQIFLYKVIVIFL